MQKTSQSKLKIEKLITRKGEKTIFKWNSYYNYFNI